MTLRRYAPLPLAALALACQPALDERANATTVEYALFNPAAGQIPTPNDIALNSAAAFLPGGAAAAVPCNLAGSTQNIGLCAYVRAGGFPVPSPIQITFLRGTLGADGVVAYAPPLAGEALDTSTLAIAGAALDPNVGVFDVTNPLAPAPVGATPTFSATTGVLTLTSSWTAGHKYVALVRGGVSGPQTLAGAPYVAMPTLYILREAVLSDRDLSLPENQGLFPGDEAAKAAAGTALEPLRVGYAGINTLTRGLAAATCPGATCINLPFGELVSMQSFTIAPGGTVTIGDAAAADPVDFSVTGGAVAMIDAFTLQSSLSAATVQAVTFNLVEGDAALTNLFVSTSATCAAASTLGTSGAPAVGNVPIPLTNWLSVGNTAALQLYVCATTMAPGSATNVTGGVAAVTTFAGTGFTSAGTDTGAQLTVNP